MADKKEEISTCCPKCGYQGAFTEEKGCNACGYVEDKESREKRKEEERKNDYYNLIVVDDIEPELVGPFGDWNDMISAASQHRDNDPDKRDGIYHITVPKGIQISLDTYSGAREV